MTVERLQQVLTAKPFRPFTIHLADGIQFQWLAAVHYCLTSGRTVVVFSRMTE
jgi:hypothetical protein